MNHEKSPIQLDCDSVRLLLSVLSDGEADPAERETAEKHLLLCPACAAHYAFLQRMRQVKPQPAMASARLSERIARATYARPTFADRMREWLTPVPNRLALGTAFAVGIVALVVVPRTNETQPLPTLPDDTATMATNKPQQQNESSAGSQNVVTGQDSVVTPSQKEMANATPQNTTADSETAVAPVAPLAAPTTTNNRIATANTTNRVTGSNVSAKIEDAKMAQRPSVTMSSQPNPMAQVAKNASTAKPNVSQPAPGPVTSTVASQNLPETNNDTMPSLLNRTPSRIASVRPNRDETAIVDVSPQPVTTIAKAMPVEGSEAKEPKVFAPRATEDPAPEPERPVARVATFKATLKGANTGQSSEGTVLELEGVKPMAQIASNTGALGLVDAPISNR